MERKSEGKADQGVFILKYRSITTAGELVSRVISSLELLTPPEEAVCYSLLNAFLLQLYSGVINDVRCIDVQRSSDGIYFVDSAADEDTIPSRSADITKVYADGYEYERVGEEYPEQLIGMEDHFYKISGDDAIILLGIDMPRVIYVSVRALPLPYSESDAQRELCLPEEFLPLAEARLRSDIYRLEGEDSLCANWTNEYNAILARFGAWLEVHSE